MNSHDYARHNMLWRVKEVKNNKEIRTLARLCDISDVDHLDNIKKMLLKEDPKRLFNGFRADTWISTINSEIRYRTKLGYTLLEGLARPALTKEGNKYNQIMIRIRPEKVVCA